MANLVITSTAFTVKLIFNSESAKYKIKKVSFRRDEISEVIEHTGDEHITVMLLDGDDFDCSFDGSGNSIKVDTVDGATSANNDELFDKLVQNYIE